MIDFEDIITGKIDKPITIEDFLTSYVICCNDYELDDSVEHGFRISSNERYFKLREKIEAFDCSRIGLKEKEIEEYIGSPKCDVLILNIVKDKERH